MQDIVHSKFRSIDLPMFALTAAGVDERIYDGNKKMAQPGESLIELLLAEDAFTAGWSRGEKQLHSRITCLLISTSWYE